MSDPLVRLHAPRQVPRSQPFAPLGRRLYDAGLITHQQLLRVLRLQRQQHAQIGEICVAEGLISPPELCAVLGSVEN